KGKAALKQLDLNSDELDPEMVNYVGRMYFRTSFGQNILGHSMEMAYLARLIAEQIGADVNVAMQAAFFHDIGKAIDHDIGGAHDDISKDILEKHNYDPRIVHAAYAHHDKVPCEAPEDFIVKAVDAISAVRPGARQESVTNYFERIKQLEDTVKGFEGIRKVFAMSAGREVRGMVDERQVKDDTMEDLAESIATRISEDLSFPGIIKVNLIRRTIATDHARERKA
ncbi:MAG: HDIG domain-containing metalloprotein, partial [Patescibacteria group bacterium]